MTTHKILTKNSQDLSPIPDHSIQLIVTSPPYPMVEMWDSLFCEQDPRIEDALRAGHGREAFFKMHALLNLVWEECDRVLADHGFLCINIGDATRTLANDFQLYPNHAQIILFFLSKGYSILPDIHWRKPSNAPNKFMGSGMYPAGAYVTYEHEYILVFRKGGKRIFTGEEKTRRQKSAYFWEERNVWFSDLWEIRGTAQEISEASCRKRNASFPLEIPYRLINMYSIEGDTVLDPFVGLGTTCLAAMLSQRSSIGVERAPDIAALAKKNLSVSPAILNQQIDLRLNRHKNFISTLSPDKQNRCYWNPFHQFSVKTKQETAIQINQLSAISFEADTYFCSYQ